MKKFTKIVTSVEMRELDRWATEEFGIPSLLLMENAGRSVAEAALRMLKKPWLRRQVSIFCGKGNNGGDGLVAGRHLMNRGVQVAFYLFAREGELSGDPLVNFRIIQKMKAEIRFGCEKLGKTDLIIDALFGTGLAKNLEEPYLSAVNLINRSRRPVLAIDIPSGLAGDTGKVMGAAVKATRTVTLGLPKKGLFVSEGPKYTGRVEIGDISMPKRLTGSIFPTSSR